MLMYCPEIRRMLKTCSTGIFYFLLVNREFDRQLLKSIKVAYLNESEPRNTRAIEKFVSENPLKSGTL